MKNPRDYISYSQLISYEKNRYYQEYILGNKQESIEMDFGSKIADGLEKGSTDKDTEFFRMWLPEVDEREKEIIETIDGIKIKIKLDGWSKEKIIYEYKTGKTPWTQSRVDDSDQLTIYSLVIWHKYHINPQIILVWIPTKNNGEEIVLTGEIPLKFVTTRSLAKYAGMLKRLKKAQIGINKLYSNL